jgi:hypothetical protein
MGMLIFAAPSSLDTLKTSAHCFADGTFRVNPPGFQQLYTIHAFIAGI